MLFERLAVSWVISGVRTDRQKELLARYRLASPGERAFVRESLRAHVSENFFRLFGAPARGGKAAHTRSVHGYPELPMMRATALAGSKS